ncbi:hypothetical protein TPL01_21110 [Sulfuriferula plumbiphila]|uniref:DUF4381 domain-containing protein n=1 Tax=Sulfuriferula plumbiphila TaxID=171865 RepID=A0A512L929_9PROT|nr:DUF4381 domain-containing protein [Sulfuriferula plumbiphila]BBP04410.1 hypothetical protein SFPGR_18320 [Sulfuriferula plumbiphila]GEP30973.1 hypothetical protein TPL01_21110 [Sulfuriferula plumbiphila]
MNPALSQLRDIHLPARISWWPPALGWWLLAAAILLIALALYGLHRHRRRNHWRRFALSELSRLRELHETQQSAPCALVSELSILLRRVAVSRFPRAEVAALNGDAWLAFLDHSLGEGAAFQSHAGRLLTTVPYRPDAAIDPGSLRALLALGERWLKKLPRGKK